MKTEDRDVNLCRGNRISIPMLEEGSLSRNEYLLITSDW